MSGLIASIVIDTQGKSGVLNVMVDSWLTHRNLPFTLTYSVAERGTGEAPFTVLDGAHGVVATLLHLPSLIHVQDTGDKHI